MKIPNRKLLNQAPHQNAARFRAAIEYTARTSGFRGELIEKDYYCSLILAYFFAEETPLVFKGGTCLNKVHPKCEFKNEAFRFKSIPILTLI